MNPFHEWIRMPVIGVYAVAIVFVFWFSFVCDSTMLVVCRSGGVHL